VLFYHVAFAVPDLEAAMEEMGPALGLHWRPVQEGPYTVTDAEGVTHEIPVRVTYSVEGPPAIEIFEARPGTPLAAPAGTALHHLGFWVDDLVGECERLGSQGWPLSSASYDDQGRIVRGAFHRCPFGPSLELLDVGFERPWLADLYPLGSPLRRPPPGSDAG
jgi:hypothetical protein